MIINGTQSFCFLPLLEGEGSKIIIILVSLVLTKGNLFIREQQITVSEFVGLHVEALHAEEHSLHNLLHELLELFSHVHFLVLGFCFHQVYVFYFLV